MTSRSTRARNSADIQQILSAYERSGLTRQEFCAQVGLPLTTFDYYRRRQCKLQQRSLVPVKVLPSMAASPTAGFTVVLRNGRKVESQWEYPESALLRLVQTLEQS